MAIQWSQPAGYQQTKTNLWPHAMGVAESLLHRLAKMPELLVVARTSPPQEADEDIQSIGAKFNARYLLVGGVQRSGERLRVTARLIDAATGVHVWSLKLSD